MSRNSNEKLAVAEAEAFLKGSESLDDPENSSRTDMIWGTIYVTKLKGRRLHSIQANLQFKKVSGSLFPTEEDAFQVSPSILCTAPVPTSSASPFAPHGSHSPAPTPLESSCSFQLLRDILTAYTGRQQWALKLGVRMLGPATGPLGEFPLFLRLSFPAWKCISPSI